MSKLLYGKPVADKLYQHVDMLTNGMAMGPLLLTVGCYDEQWMQYTQSLANSCAKHNIRIQNDILSDYDEQLFVDRLNGNLRAVEPNGVLVQQPLPSHMHDFVNFVPIDLDIDCVTDTSVARLYRGEQGFRPATAQAVVEMLDFYDIPLQGKRVVVVGRGNAVGKPLALMLLQRNATVTICHSKTQNLAEVCRGADILVSATGQPGLITADFVTPNSIVIDVGLSFVDGKTCGDVDPTVYDIVQAVSPVPGGIGPVTRAALLCNLLDGMDAVAERALDQPMGFNGKREQ